MTKFFPSISILIPELTVGNQPAWNLLADKFRAGLTGKARLLLRQRKLVKKYSPDDLVQETIMKAWTKHETFAGTTTAQFAKWILVIMQNTCCDWFRCSADELSIATWFDFSDHGDSPSAQAISLEREAALHACLAELKPKYRQVIILHHFEGLRFTEIAQQYDLNVNTVASDWRRGATKLKAMMSARTEWLL